MGSIVRDPYATSSTPYSTTYGYQSNSPFSAKVPETGVVLGILLLYFVLEVPVNLLILRKLGKGELAWITSPVISLAFAFVFFRFSSGLYAANLSVATSGVLVQHQGDATGTFLGNTQIFFPQGGRYDLRLEGIEAVFTEDRFTGNPNQIPAMASLGMVDDGEVRAPSAAVTNLAFREFSFVQTIPTKDLVAIKLKRTNGKVTGVEIQNRSPYRLDRTGVILNAASFSVGTLQPGESKTVTQQGYEGADLGPNLAMNQVTQSNLGSKKDHPLGAVTAIASDLRVGPQIGTNNGSINNNWVVFTFREGRP